MRNALFTHCLLTVLKKCIHMSFGTRKYPQLSVFILWITVNLFVISMVLAYLFWNGWWQKYPSMDEYPKMRRMSLEITILWSLPSFWRTTDLIRVFWRWGDCVKRGRVSTECNTMKSQETYHNLSNVSGPPNPLYPSNPHHRHCNTPEL